MNRWFSSWRGVPADGRRCRPAWTPSGPASSPRRPSSSPSRATPAARSPPWPAAAGVAAGTVYNHFAGKAELVAEVFRAVVGREVAAVREAVASAPTTVSRITRLRRDVRSSRAEVAPAGLRAAGRAGRSGRRRAAAGVPGRLPRHRRSRDRATASRAASCRRRTPRVVAAALVGAIGEALVGPLSGRARPGRRPHPRQPSPCAH